MAAALLRTAVEERVSREDHLLVAVLREPAYAVLRMARRVEALDSDAPDLEAVAVGRGLRDGLAVLASDDGQVRGPQVAALETSR